MPKNTVVPKNQVWVGQPAKYLRNILPEEKENVAENLSELIELSSVLVEETEKSQQDLILDNYYFQDSAKLSVDEKKHLYENMLAYSVDKNADDFGIEGIGEGYGDIEEEGLYRHNLYKVFKDESFDMKFHQDFRNYPDYFRIYNENFKRYDEINRRSENIAPGEMRDVFEIDKLKPERPGAMRAWVSKWDPDFNITFKNVGSKVESNNK